MEFQVRESAGEKAFIFSGRLTFTDQQEFVKVLESLKGDMGMKRCIFDLENVTFVDSAFLGLLVLARHETEGLGDRLALRKPTGKVRKIMEATKLDELFTIIEH